MRKKIFLFLAIFIFIIIPKNVYAEQGDVFATSICLSDSCTGSQAPTNTIFGTRNYFKLHFNFLNNFDTFQVGNNYKIDFSYCLFTSGSTLPSAISSYSTLSNFGFTGASLDINIGGTCIYTQPPSAGGNAYTGTKVYGSVNFTLGDDSPGQLVYNVVLGSTTNFSVGFLDYRLLYNDDIVAQENTQMLIINQNENTQDLINSFTQNIGNLINAQNANQQQTNQRLDNINNSINDDSTDANYQNSTLDSLNNQMASNSVISDLLLLPVRMYQKILDGLGSNSCVAYNLGSLYGTNLVLPCIQVQNYVGTALWTTIDLIFCGMFILVIRKKFVDIFNNMTNLKDRGNEIE